MKNISFFLIAISIAACLLLPGCWGGKSEEPGTDPTKPTASTETDKNELKPTDLVIRDEAPLPASALSQLPNVQETLEKMIYAYKNANSYSDQAFCQAYIRHNNNETNQSSPFFFSFVKPNKLQYISRTCEIRADGKTISAFIPALPGVILQKPCPPEIHLEDILFDQAIDEAVFMSQPSRFSVLPLQWIMFFSKDPLKTLTFGQKEIRALAPREINGRPCYRLRFDREDGTAVLWIDQETGLILRAQLPAQQLANSMEGADVNNCSLTVEFCEPKTNADVPDSAFAMEIPVGTYVTDKYTAPTTRLLGEKISEFRFSKLDDAGEVNNSILEGKVALLHFWTTWSKLEPSVAPQINQLREKYKNDKDVTVLSVSIDDSNISDAVIRDTLRQWKSPIDCLRDYNSFLPHQLKINSVPVVIAVNKNGVIEMVEMGFNPLLVNEASECIDKLKQGVSVYKQEQESRLAEAEQYERHRKEWLAREIFVDADVIEQTTMPETVAAQPTQPRQFQLKPLWTVNDIQNPGGIISEDSQEDAPGKLWALENGKNVVQISQTGSVEARYDLGLDAKETCSFIRKSPTGKNAAQFLAFAPGQQRIHVYDNDWKNLFHYPDDALQRPHEGIQDARFGNLENSDEPEIYIGFLGTRGAQSINCKGGLRWSNRALGTVFSVAPYRTQNENLILCCAGSSGMITVLHKDGKTFGDGNKVGVIDLKNNLAAMVYSANLKPGDKSDDSAPIDDSLCALCPNQNAYLLVGFNMRSEILWTYKLSQGIPKRPIDYLTSADIMPNGDAIWIALGSDGSIHFINRDGLLIDSFNHGQFVYGLTLAKWDGKRVLILSDSDGVKAYEIIWNELPQ